MTGAKIDMTDKTQLKATDKGIIELYQKGAKKFYAIREKPNVEIGETYRLTAFKSRIPFKAKVTSLDYKEAGKVWEYVLKVIR